MDVNSVKSFRNNEETSKVLQTLNSISDSVCSAYENIYQFEKEELADELLVAMTVFIMSLTDETLTVSYVNNLEKELYNHCDQVIISKISKELSKSEEELRLYFDMQSEILCSYHSVLSEYDRGQIASFNEIANALNNQSWEESENELSYEDNYFNESFKYNINNIIRIISSQEKPFLDQLTMYAALRAKQNKNGTKSMKMFFDVTDMDIIN